MRRDNEAVRSEVRQPTISFLYERMNVVNDGTIKSLITILEAKSPKVLITSSRELVSQMSENEATEELVSDA